MFYALFIALGFVAMATHLPVCRIYFNLALQLASRWSTESLQLLSTQHSLKKLWRLQVFQSWC